MSRRYLAALLAACLMTGATAAQAAEAMEFTLDRAIAIALENNLGLRSARVDTQIQTSAVEAEEARFGRTLTGGIAHQSERSPSISTLEAVQNTTTDGQTLSIGLAQELAGGGRVGVEFSNSRSSSNVAFRTIDPVYNSALQLSFTQPLLQGRGRINQTALGLARNDLEATRVGLDDRIRQLRADVGLAYWNLFFARADLEAKQQLHAGALRVLETVRARADMGTGTRNSILQAEVGVARRQEEIVVAEGSLRAAEDLLKARCRLDRDPTAWALQLVLVDTPSVVPFAADLEAGVDRALETSAAYRQARLQLDNLDLQIALARDRTRPAVDLNARVGLTGIGGSYADDIEGLTKADGRSWGGSLSLDFPLGQTSEEAIHQRRLLEKQRRQIDLEDLRLQIVQEVRDRHRQVRISHQRTEAARAAVRLAAQNVDEQETRLGLGMATVREVLDAQDDLAGSRANLLQAVVDYSEALILWQQLTGEGS